jgi:hypothetical protein
VQLARDAAFDSLIVDDSTATDTLRQVGPLDHSRRYYWRVRAINAGSTTGFTPVWSFATLDPPSTYALSQNYPNPFNPVTRVAVQIPEETEIEVAVFNLIGQKVLTVMEGVQKPGRYEVEIDARTLASGVYFYRLKSSTYSMTRKLMVVR